MLGYIAGEGSLSTLLGIVCLPQMIIEVALARLSTKDARLCDKQQVV